MTEVHSCLFIGEETDYEITVKHQQDWWIVHACKEPYHRRLLGYKSRGAPKEHPEYLFARRATRLYLNLVDAANPDYIPKQIIDVAIAFIDEAFRERARVLVHCNQGESRSPSIGLLYLATRTVVLPKTSLSEAEACFRQLYPRYNPSAGMRGFLARHWGEYVDLDA